MWDKYNLRQHITLESFLILFTLCNPTDNFDVGLDSWVFMFADFGEALCSLLLAILATYSSIAVGWKKADLHHDGSGT